MIAHVVTTACETGAGPMWNNVTVVSGEIMVPSP